MNQENCDILPTAPESPPPYEGYSNLGFVDSCPNLSYNPPSQTNSDQPVPNFKEVPHLTEDEAREVLAAYVSEHCCYGKKPVRELQFTNLQSSHIYRYILETFTETRNTKYCYEPYFNQIIINNGIPPPRPWDILVQPQGFFQNEQVEMEIPNTAHVEVCNNCRGLGWKNCFSCSGRGRTSCPFCNGNSHSYGSNSSRPQCSSCHGSGFKNCFSCNGTGRTSCSNCRSSGRLKWFIKLIVKFQNNQEDFIKKEQVIPDKLLRKCMSKDAFSDENIRVYPISYNIPEISQASQNLIASHLNKYAQHRILRQRQKITVIPATFCSYKWSGDKVFTFHVFGLDNKVFAPDYPRKCCGCCCSIL